MIHNDKQKKVDFPYLQVHEIGNQGQTPAEKSVTRAVAMVKIAYTDGVWVKYNAKFYPNVPEKIVMGDSWAPAGALCGHYDPSFVVRGIKIIGDGNRQICFDMRFPDKDHITGDDDTRYLIDSFMAEVIHPVELTRLWLDKAREATTCDVITLYK